MGQTRLGPAVLLAVSPFALLVAIVVALVVRLQMGSPVFFRQVRPGHKAKPFYATEVSNYEFGARRTGQFTF